MSKEINIGIIGAGIVGERVIKALGRHGGAKILGIYDTNTDRLRYISDEYSITAVDSYMKLLDNKSIDLIYLAVPPKYHHSIAMDIIKAKKHLLCEKPLANTTKEAEEMYKTAEAAGIIHAINFPTIYSNAFNQMESLLQEGYIGKLRRIELHGYFRQWPRAWQQTDWIASKEQGGFVREVFTHFVQIIHRRFGEVQKIDTFIEENNDPNSSETGIIATGVLKDGTRILFNGFSSIGIEDSLSLNIYGTEGALSLCNWRELWSTTIEGRSKVEVSENDHLVALLQEVFNAIEGKAAELVTFKEGLEVQRTMEALLGKE